MSGFGNDDDDNGAGKPGGRSAGRAPVGCGHHIMLACAARREVRGRGAAFSPPGAMYAYNSGHGLSGTGVRHRRDDDGRGEACDR